MTTLRMTLAFGILLLSTPTLDAAKTGYARSDNFTVLTPQFATAQEANAYAQEILYSAEHLRRRIACEWLGEELPQSVGRTVVTVSWNLDRDAGLTWVIDDPRRRYHALYLATSPELAIGSTLAHEMVHVVLATRFPHPNRLPAFLEEAIASQFDDNVRQQERQQQLLTFMRTHKWPRLEDVLNAKNIAATDTQAYAASVSVVSLLLARDPDKQKLFAFGLHGTKSGWDAALQQYYDIPSVHQLQSLWQGQKVSATVFASGKAWRQTNANDGTIRPGKRAEATE